VSRVWLVESFDSKAVVNAWPTDLAGEMVDVEGLARRFNMRDGQRFLIRSDGYVDLRVNAFLASARMRNLAATTNRDYSHCLALWLSFLGTRDCDWTTATEDDIEEFAFWRRTDPANCRRVGSSAFAKDLAACKKFYSWAAARFSEISDIFAEIALPRSKRSARIRWLDPSAVQRWRDIGLRGYDAQGRRDQSWRGRNEQRDAAFFDGLYGTGLRLTEWASVLLLELPTLEMNRAFYTSVLADRCAKGGYGHRYWTPQAALSTVRAYMEGSRARAVREAQLSGRYDSLSDVVMVSDTRRPGRLVVSDANGDLIELAVNDVDVQLRLRLYRRTDSGIEPLFLWLNENGLPRDPHGWHHTFAMANERIAQQGLVHFTCTPHMLRHSFALRWFSVGKLVYLSKLAHLSEEEAHDFRAQFGDTWHLVQTMLGHRRVDTTKDVYLEPFRNLDVEILLAQAQGLPVSELIADMFASHEMVRSDPLAVR
jgi:site-specific recombinase XerD